MTYFDDLMRVFGPKAGAENHRLEDVVSWLAALAVVFALVGIALLVLRLYKSGGQFGFQQIFVAFAYVAGGCFVSTFDHNMHVFHRDLLTILVGVALGSMAIVTTIPKRKQTANSN